MLFLKNKHRSRLDVNPDMERGGRKWINLICCQEYEQKLFRFNQSDLACVR
jgi:hypothetical protein